VRSCYPSPGRSHGVLAEAEDFHDSLSPKKEAWELVLAWFIIFYETNPTVRVSY